jgi:hypothetical protein
VYVAGGCALARLHRRRLRAKGVKQRQTCSHFFRSLRRRLRHSLTVRACMGTRSAISRNFKCILMSHLAAGNLNLAIAYCVQVQDVVFSFKSASCNVSAVNGNTTIFYRPANPVLNLYTLAAATAAATAGAAETYYYCAGRTGQKGRHSARVVQSVQRVEQEQGGRQYKYNCTTPPGNSR